MVNHPWRNLLLSGKIPLPYEKRLEGLQIKEVVISQDKQTWEIAFLSSFSVTEEERSQILEILRHSFGRHFQYNLSIEEKDVAPDVGEMLKTVLSSPEIVPSTLADPEEEEELLNQRLKEKLNGTKDKKQGPCLILGRKISGSPRPLKEVREESMNTIIEGKAFRINDQRLLKAGTQLYDFDITDYTNSLKVKVFLDPKRQKSLKADWLKKNAWYRMKGSVKYDQFTKELAFFPDDIMEGDFNLRQDNAPEKRVELHLHTKLSAMDAMSTPEELISQAIAWGHEAIAITDHGVVQAFPEAMKMAKVSKDKKPPIKIIYGLEGYLIEGDGKAYMEEARRPKKGVRGQKEELSEGELLDQAERQGSWHIIILAKNAAGIKNLYKLISLSHLDFFYKKPRIPRSELIRLREGLIIGSACEAGELFQQVLSGADERTLENTAAFYDYLEIQPIKNNEYLLRNGRVANEEGLRTLNRRILALGRRMGKPVVATGDVHFLQPEDEVFRRILQAGQGYKDADLQPPLYLRTTEEMLQEFDYLGEEEAYKVVVEATREVAAQVEYLNPIPGELQTPKLPGAKEEVERMVREKAAALYGDVLPDWIKERLEKEIKSITEYGYADLYYIAHKLVKYSNENGYVVGSRGSVGSSLVAFLTDITEVNPLAPHYRCPNPACKHVELGDASIYGCGADMPALNCPGCGTLLVKDGFNIPFEVFLGFEGDKVPDIDLNFSGEYQTQAQKYTEELFGRENVFKAGTISTVADKTAYGFVKNYFKDRSLVVREAEVERLVQGCAGVRRTTGQHPGGIVVLPKGDEITNYTPVQRPADDPNSEFVTTHFDYHAIDNCLVKLDILGHDDPTVIRLLVQMTGKDIREIYMDDPAVISLFQSPEALGIDKKESGIETGSLGVPEFGTSFVRGMLLDTKPATFSDLVRISGFSHGTDVWLGNAREILKENLGTMKEVIGCRDDIMITLIQAGLKPKHAFKIMEQVRKGKGLSREDVEAMEAANVPEWYIGSCQKIKYLFPKAHAVAYVTMAFRIAWFKVFEPLCFYAATFSVRGGLDGTIAAGGRARIEEAMADIRAKRERKEASARDEDLFTSLELAREMVLRGFSFAPVSLEKSSANRFLVEENQLRLPFNALPGLGLNAAQSIVEGRQEKPYRSKEDLRRRGKVGKSLLEVLQQHGALAGLPESDQQTIF